MNGDQQTFEMRRRLARMRSGDARVPRSASALQVWLWLLVFVFQNEFRISMSIQPGYLDFDNLPETNFTCEGKVIGGYYADLETSCQMFHVCTVGQADEPMDIKFLCLNGTVFDQETRVCERVDEVDCTKSEKFYSLNLELYGNTIAPPVKQNVTGEEEADNKREEEKAKEDVSSSQKNKVNSNTNIKVQAETDKVVVQKPHNAYLPTTIASQTESAEHIEPEEENEEEEEIDSELPDYDDDYNPSTTTSTYVTSTRASISTVTSNNKEPIVTTAKPTQSTSDELPSTLDPALLSPQEFIYRHRGQGTEAISFQRQGFRPADGVYITHAPHTNNYEYKYESSRTVARPTNQNAPFVQRPSPAPFRPTNQEPNEQMLRPIAATQATNPTNQRAAPYPPASLPPQRALPYEPYYYERKRSEVTSEGDESSLSARSISLPPIEKNSKIKSPPRVIVTASASVSDSNGKRLNYTVGNVVSAVKPIVPINYDDYKETDLIFDPFFLDVPKLSKRRKSRHDKDDTTTTKHNPRAIHSRFIAEKKYAGLRKSFTATPTSIVKSTTPHSVNVNDYVDDNYEPHVYKPPHADINKPEENKVASLEDDKKYVNYDNQRLSIRTKDKTIETTKLTTSSQSPLLETPIINPPRIVAHNNHPKTVCRTCV